MTIFSHRTYGFTLVEIMVVLLIIALLAAIAIPNLQRAYLNAKVTQVAQHLKTFGDAFYMYSLDNGIFPADSHLTLPAGMEDYINQSNWDTDALGGDYNWDGPTWGAGGTYPYAGISIFGTTATVNELQVLDETIDDGNLSTGKFRQTANGRYTYIIEE